VGESIIMRRLLHRSAVAACLLTAIAGCSSFLDADRATADPNLPSAATRDQLFTGAQANIFAQQEGPLAMIACQWMQQCAGINNRFVQTQDSYRIDALTFDLPFQETYSAGGLLSIRAVQASAEAAGDDQYLGITQILEALLIGTAADIWGDIPYSEAAFPDSIPTPAFDAQMDIYAVLQTLLDEAIANLAGTGPGPGPVDLFYGGNTAQWTQAAYTLKARYHMHTAEVLGDAALTAARTAALSGISSAANSLRTAHSTATSERNMWVQFQATSGFGLDLVAGRRLADLMNAHNDQRRVEYFAQNILGGFGGFDVTTGTTPAEQISPLSGPTGSPNTRGNVPQFRQPIVTWEENQLILAETNFELTGAAAALPFLTAVRAAHGKAPVAATLQSIIEEKYISMFQTIEVWSDWKRTCLPTLNPAFGTSAIPGRLYYGQTEEQTNPNTPPSSEQDLATVRNANDPNGC
jgi:hypothetical protein